MVAAALAVSNETDDALVCSLAEQLLERGYVIIPELAAPARLQALCRDFESHFHNTPFCQGGFYGERTKRFGRLLIRSPETAHFVRHELVLGIVERVLSSFCESLQLNLTQAIEIFPGARVQAPHRDQEMFDDGVAQRQ